MFKLPSSWPPARVEGRVRAPVQGPDWEDLGNCPKVGFRLDETILLLLLTTYTFTDYIFTDYRFTDLHITDLQITD